MKCEQYSDLSNYFAAMMERLPPESFARLHDPSEAKDSCLRVMVISGVREGRKDGVSC